MEDIKENSLEQTLNNMNSLPTLVPWTRILAIIMAISLVLIILLQIARGVKGGLPITLIVFSVLLIVSVLSVDLFFIVYGVNCAAVGAKEDNNCGLFSKVYAYLLCAGFILSSIVTSSVIYKTIT